MAQAIEGGDTITRQSFFPFFFIAQYRLHLDAQPVVAQRTTTELGATARVYAPPLPPSFAPIPPPGRYWCCFIAHYHPTQPCLPSVRPLLLSQVPMPPPSLRTWGCYCAGICAPPTPLFRFNPASGPLLVLLHRPPPPHSDLPPLSPPSPPLPDRPNGPTLS
jgi:hypothetical protein